MKRKHAIIPIFVPHKGCPFDCIYCNQKSISGQLTEMSEYKMKSTIELHLNTISPDSKVEIAFYGGSFTGIDQDTQFKLLGVANEYVKMGKVSSIRISTRPDYINGNILDYLSFYNVNTIELGVQSLDEVVLKESSRGHTVDDVITSSHLIKDRGFELGIQTMVGLPYDSRNKAIDTAKKVVALSPDVVRIYPTLVIRGTYLEVLYRKGVYVPLGLEEAVDICSALLYLYTKADINVIRIGLQPTENINESSDVVTGPFHPAFRQLVEARLSLEKIRRILVDMGTAGAKYLVFEVPEQQISNVIGQKRSNIDILKKEFGLEEIKVKVNNSPDNELKVRCIL